MTTLNEMRLQERIAELEAEKAELVKDRERLDWLDHMAGGVEIELFQDRHSGATEVCVCDLNGRRHICDTLRDAIDAAREGG